LFTGFEELIIEKMIAQTLLHWYDANKRDLPWRHTRDPYKIWLSEIILQQTRVDQGLPYYQAFVQKYKNVCALAAAPEDEVLKTWQGLGYYSRARNLHHTARQVCTEHAGKFPQTYKELLGLKGVGPYTAAAISSFAFGQAQPVVDGNVFRVISRLYALDVPIDHSSARSIFEQYAAGLMEQADPADFNQAIMEFGALQCVPVAPDCHRCVLADPCLAFREGRVPAFPVKGKKQQVKTVYFNFLHFQKEKSTFLEKRTEAGIWKNMYQFPLVESEKIWILKNTWLPGWD
jgi:A/G-specific adenine glycosylase